MTRALLEHEIKTLQLLLHNKEQSNHEIPQFVTNLFVPMSSAEQRPIQINSPFTQFFQEGNHSTNLEPVANASCIPGLLGSSLYLVVDKETTRIAFLELTPEAEANAMSIEPHGRLVSDFLLQQELNAEEIILANQVRALFYGPSCTAIRESRGIQHARIWTLGNCVCFFFGQSDTLLHCAPADSRCSRTANGVLHTLNLHDGEIAFDGWLLTTETMEYQAEL